MPIGRLFRVPTVVAGFVATALTGAYAAGVARSRPGVSASTSAPAPAPFEDPLLRANDKIRDAAKWLIGSAAAVGAALIAGSQLSSLGKLDAVWPPSSIDRARLYVAGLGVLLALCGITYTIWRAVRLFLPVTVTLRELDESWRDPEHHKAMQPVVAFLKANPTYLLGLADPADLLAQQAEAEQELASGDSRTSEAPSQRLLDLDNRESTILSLANHRLLRADFMALLKRVVTATAVVAIGITGFAWAANPSTPSPSVDLRSANLTNGDLQGVDLSGARLDGVNFTGANLAGATLSGSSLTNVVWSHTICPDKTNSDAHGHTCLGHLDK